MNPVAVSGQYPVKRVIEEFPDGLDQGPSFPNETGWSFQRLGVGIPPKMVAGDEKSLAVQQRHAAGRMARYGNDLEFRSDPNRLLPFDHPFRPGSGLRIRLMDDTRRAEMRGILIRIRHIILVGQKDMRYSSLPLKDFNEMFDLPRGVDQPIAGRMFNEKDVRSE